MKEENRPYIWEVGYMEYIQRINFESTNKGINSLRNELVEETNEVKEETTNDYQYILIRK